jgi:hypothetical protein
MTVLYIGIALLAVGWIMLTTMGVSSEEYEKGTPYTKSDNIAGYLMILGVILVVWFGITKFARFAWDWLLSLFYGADSTYGQLTFWDHCQMGCAGAAVLFFLSLATAFHAEGQFRRVRNHNHAKAARIRDSWKRYAGWLHNGGLLVLCAVVGSAIYKTL